MNSKSNWPFTSLVRIARVTFKSPIWDGHWVHNQTIPTDLSKIQIFPSQLKWTTRCKSHHVWIYIFLILTNTLDSLEGINSLWILPLKQTAKFQVRTKPSLITGTNTGPVLAPAHTATIAAINIYSPCRNLPWPALCLAESESISTTWRRLCLLVPAACGSPSPVSPRGTLTFDLCSYPAELEFLQPAGTSWHNCELAFPKNQQHAPAFLH